MPTKFQLITELYDQTVQSVTGSYQSWTGFLRAACYNYKCPFDDQILIYAQRPDATAVLEMERWNRQFGRWVNRGAKSIAVFGDDGQNCLKLYFDVSDTHASRFARPLPIWTMHPAFEPEVIETLEATFGNLAEKENLADAVRSACHNAVADNFTDYLQDLRECREDSLLEELDECIPDHRGPEQAAEERVLAECVSAFLRGQTADNRYIFLRRYWYGEDIAAIAKRLDCGESRVKSALFRTRKALRAFLEKEGIVV